MHSHEKTLLSKFGFSDPDRRSSLHDLACQYLMTDEVCQRFIQYAKIEHDFVHYEGGNYEGDNYRHDYSRKVVATEISMEQEISKGEGKYRTTIGFADVVLRFRVEELQVNVTHLIKGAWIPQKDRGFYSTISYGIEVKISPITIGDLLRQINLYRSYSTFSKWAVVTNYPLTTADAECLKSEKILHLQLGSHFEAFRALQDQQDSSPGLEI